MIYEVEAVWVEKLDAACTGVAVRHAVSLQPRLGRMSEPTCMICCMDWTELNNQSLSRRWTRHHAFTTSRLQAEMLNQVIRVSAENYGAV
jgi:hypothetical protein